MAKRLRSLYEWEGGALRRIGDISEARLRAWEYRQRDERWEVESDVVRAWETARPDLRIPEVLWVGERES